MPFFARPNLDDAQFKQLSGTTLTLSGQTRIANVTGFSLSSGGTTYIPIIVTGGTNLDVLTLVNGQIVLHTPTSGTSSGTYTCASPTTVTVGGLPSGSPINGQTIARILEEILVPTLSPTLTSPSSSFSITPSTLIYEIGCSISITGCITFNPGCINPQYTSACDKRSNGSQIHQYQDFSGGIINCACTTPTGSIVLPSYTVVAGTRTAYGSVCYCCGVQPKDSAGNNYSSPLSSGITTAGSAVVCGILPWYWGLNVSGTITGTTVAAGNKCVGSASGILPITYDSSPTDYLWFAVPAGTPVKTCWYVNGINNGCIGGIGNLFSTYCTLAVTSVQGCWTGCNYDVYVSCVPTGTAVGIPMCMY